MCIWKEDCGLKLCVEEKEGIDTCYTTSEQCIDIKAPAQQSNRL